MRGLASLPAVLVAALAAGCAPPVPAPDGGAGGGAPDAGHGASAALQACADLQAQPLGSIARVVDRLNALPRPVSAACLVASLPRPLELVATFSVNSAQPAASAKSPRIFVLEPGVVLSVVPEGAGAALLELGEWVSSTRTRKGELDLPVTTALEAHAPFSHVDTGAGASTCATCHRAETVHGGGDAGYDSVAFRPNPGQEVKVTALQAEHEACVAAGDASARCDLFHALFDLGTARQGAFAQVVELFF